MTRKKAVAWSVSIALMVGISASCFAQNYQVNLLVDGNTALPNGSGFFALADVAPTSTDGRYVTFVNYAPDATIYTYDTRTAQFANIVDLTTIPPGSSAAFTSFFNGYNNPNAPLVAGGIVVLWGAYGGGGAGIYSAPAAGGGPVTLIANTGMAAPGAPVGATFTNNLDGSVPTRIGDSSVFLDGGTIYTGYTDWYFPTISNGEAAVLSVVGAGDPSRAQNAIVTAPYTGIVGDPYPYCPDPGPPGCLPPRPTETVSTTNLPGNTNTNFHTRFDAFALNNSMLAILADDAFGTYEGIFTAPAALGQVNAPLTELVSNVDHPNMSFQSSQGIAYDNGTVVFGANNLTNININGYTATPGIFAYPTSGKGLIQVAQSLVTPVANRPGTTIAGVSPSGVGLNSASNGAIAFIDRQGSLYLATLTGTPPREAGIFRNNSAWLLDANGNRQFDGSGPGQDLYYNNFVPPKPGDIPVVGDWSGSGNTKIGIYRPSTGTWFLDYNGDGIFDAGDKTYQFGGIAGDRPVVGDWTGSGFAKIGIFRSGYFWILDDNGDGTFDAGDQAFAYGGVTGDVPVTGDWTGDGKAKVGVVRVFYPGGTPAFWILDANNDHGIDTGDLIFAFGGITGDVPVVGDWNASGYAKAGVFRDGFFWVVDNNGSAPTVLGGSQVEGFAFGGIASDVPIVGKW